MNARAKRVGILAILLVALGALAGLGQVYPQGLIIDPPQSEVLEVSIMTDQAEYQIGEFVTISYEVNKAAYIYIWDIMPDGQVQVVFPNAAYPGGLNNYVQAGVHQLPQSFEVAPPLGTEYLQILATTQPIDIGAFTMSDPGLFQQQVEVQVLGLLLEDERSWNFTSFEITDQAPPNYATFVITSTPPGATIELDGVFIGHTPRTHFVTQGLHRVSISKPGYSTYSLVVVIFGTGSRTIHADLIPLFPSNSPPSAAFVYNPASPPVGSFVQFDASASVDADGTIVDYDWDFGDGTSGNGQVIWHRFTAGGSFQVTLTVTDDDGASDAVSQTIQVGPTNLPPVAAFTFNPASPDTGVWVQFNATASFDPDGSIVSYSWNFGDGGSDFGSFVWHRFIAGGAYPVTLTVVDDDGASVSTTEIVQVGSTNLAPNAAFVFSPASPGIGEWVRFDASASSDPDGSIVDYRWTFGDGSSPELGSVTYHPFPAAGTYLVTLVVTDNDGDSDSVSQQVVVGPAQQPPVAAFTYSPLTPQAGQMVTFNATSSFDPDGTIASYQWDLNGDSLPDASGATGQVTYSTAGAVIVTLTVTDNDGLSTSTSQQIVVSAPGGPVGAPAMGTTPGVFVWGSDSWHVTVNAGAGWAAPRNYRLELRTDGAFVDVNEPFDGGVIPLGLIIEPIDSGKTLVFEGSIQSGSLDHTFRIPESSSVWMRLLFDIDGNGVLDESSSFVYLRHSMVNPPDVPMVLGSPAGYTGELLPTIDFRVGTAWRYDESVRWVFWRTTISALESI